MGCQTRETLPLAHKKRHLGMGLWEGNPIHHSFKFSSWCTFVYCKLRMITLLFSRSGKIDAEPCYSYPKSQSPKHPTRLVVVEVVCLFVLFFFLTFFSWLKHMFISGFHLLTFSPVFIFKGQLDHLSSYSSNGRRFIRWGPSIDVCWVCPHCISDDYYPAYWPMISIGHPSWTEWCWNFFLFSFPQSKIHFLDFSPSSVVPAGIQIETEITILIVIHSKLIQNI